MLKYYNLSLTIYLQESQYIDVILDVTEIDETEKRCRFKDNETLGDVLSAVTEDFSLDLSQCQVVLLSQPDKSLNLSYQASDFVFQSVLVISSTKNKLPLTFHSGSECSAELSSVAQCIGYFSCFGLKSLNGTSNGEHSSLPDLPSLGYDSWEDLLDKETIESLTDKDEEQQIAIWELLYTECSHLTQLAVVINTFMRSLEHIQSIDLLTEVNYHNIFGLMRDIYNAHWKFWTVALLPCIQQAASSGKPLDVEDLVRNFPQFNEMFEVYERHCIFERQNLQALDEAMNNVDFKTYIKWCESRPECKRLRLKDYLAKPMQRLTKYPLLLTAILNKTTNQQSRGKLQDTISMVDEFVSKVNVALQHQDEVEKVKNVAQRLTSTSVIRDLPSGWEKYLQPYLQLDLLAPMPGINLHQPRTLVMEGPLRYKDDTIKMDVEVFLFTDMLLITRASKKSPGKLVIVKAPFKIDSLIVKLGKDAAFDLVYLNELQLVSNMFSFKAAAPQIASAWIEGIQQAQQFYYQLRCSHESKRSSGIWNTLNCPRVSQRSISPCSSMSESTVSTVSRPRISQHSLSPNNSTSESPLEALRSFSSQYSLRYCYTQPPTVFPPIITCPITQDACTQTDQPSTLTEGPVLTTHTKVTRSTSNEEQASRSTLSRSSQSLNKIHDVNTKSNVFSRRRSKSMKLIKV
ncbi:pleckstrin homology domain-containing family G member 5-like isoform X2 [Dysidea avara]|uniref:pleckstrin homology domain-containing family G member 5-like isoform X2 n=1 Tax=Dysidea avara TaxID=196820 RepID=UPI00331CAD6E